MAVGSEMVKRTWQKKRKFIYDYKAERGCADCKEQDPWVLDLDHTDPTTKQMRAYPSQQEYRKSMNWHSMSWDRLVGELSKCEVRCANCHRRRTATQQNWKRY
jgi:hypothetical protein